MTLQFMHEQQQPPFNHSQPSVAFRREITDGSADRLKSICLLSVIVLTLGQTPLPAQFETATDLYTSEYEKFPQVDQFYTERFRESAREQQEKFRIRVAIPAAVRDDVPTLATVNEAKQLAAAPVSIPGTSSGRSWLVLLGLILGSILVVRRFFPDAREQIKEYFNWRECVPRGTLADLDYVRVEGQAFAEFVTAFRSGPTGAMVVEPEQSPRDEFFARWPKVLADLRKQLQEVRQSSDSKERRRQLYDLGREFRSLKDVTGIPELLPVWQMACAMEGLLKQLGDKVYEVTGSTLRTLAGAVDLLAELCKPGLNAKLLTSRPIRLLAVDDDPISRHAISYALKRALNAPDLAESGEAGLTLAQKNKYDVIFLDVEMPDMNGFELCTLIHKIVPNRTTPVVFVTGQSDFNARVQATLSGGCDLIAKPFLTFELAVKAITLAIQNRLQEGKPTESKSSLSQGMAKEMIASSRVVIGTSPEAAPAVSTAVKGDSVASFSASDPARIPDIPESLPQPDLQRVPISTSAPCRDSSEVATEFLMRAPEHLKWVSETLHDALKITDEAAWLPMLADVYLRLNSFTPEEKNAKGNSVMQLSSALEALLRKLLQGSTPPTKSTMMTLRSGVELLRELCMSASEVWELNAAVHILVVDDDPVARRALVGALQATFEKPVCAENGTVALALAAEKPFDLIFLDVLMPGMDGFEVFAQIRTEGCNAKTPIVFVSGLQDLETATTVKARGDCDVLTKPFLAGELLVKALTLVLRHRRACREVVA